jgi:CheY-like chemotaxis protein
MDSPNRTDVLVVDDDKGIRALVARALLRLGVACDTACDGEDALEHVNRNRYLVVVVDLMMPKVDGQAFVTALRERDKTSGLRPVVLLMTAFPLQDLPPFGSQVQVVIQKPFDVFELAELVRDCVEACRRHEAGDAVRSAGADGVAAYGPLGFIWNHSDEN